MLLCVGNVVFNYFKIGSGKSASLESQEIRIEHIVHRTHPDKPRRVGVWNNSEDILNLNDQTRLVERRLIAIKSSHSRQVVGKIG